MSAFSQALLAYHQGDLDAHYSVRRDDGFSQTVPVSIHFDSKDFSELERNALELSYGRVLDIGACAGRHSLALIEQGCAVVSLDIEPDIAKILNERGLKNVVIDDIMMFEGGKFDTLIMLMNGIGMVANPEGLDNFLKKLPSLLSVKGQLLCDSVDVTQTKDPVHVTYREKNIRMGRSVGQQTFRIAFGELSGEPFQWLHLEPKMLEKHCKGLGLKYETIFIKPTGQYLACIRL